MKIQDDDILLLNQEGRDHKITAKQYKEFVNSNPWDEEGCCIYHVIIDDPADINLERYKKIYNLATKAEVTAIDAPGEWIITGDWVAFEASRGNWRFGHLTDHSKRYNMDCMFAGAVAFNSDISNWDVSNVDNMVSAFEGCKAFNCDISNWDVSAAEHFMHMFRQADAFNQDLSQWCVNNPVLMESYPDGNFKLGDESWPDEHKPVWGTCPRGEDQS